MKNRLIVFAGLFILLISWSLLISDFHSKTADAAGLKQVILRVEGMT
jgi:hypothetical protein